MAETSSAKELIAAINNVSSSIDLENDITARRKVLELSQKLSSSLKAPTDAATELPFAPFISTAARIAVDLNLFGLISDEQDAVTAIQLAKSSGAEELLISRVMRICTSVGLAVETAENTYAANSVTNVLSTSPIRSGHKFVFGMLISAAVKAPRYLSENGYVCPTSPHDGFIQYAFQTKLSMFDYMASMPAMFEDFNNFMGNTMGARSYWDSWFPVKSRLLEGYDPETPLIVDIGGGKGHDLAQFAARFPGDERLILQDLREVLDSPIATGLDSRIERMPHDFFKSQPVKGSRAYFMHHILHDWADEYCLKILHALKHAMTPGYSKLLIHELILPNTGATTFQAIFDLTMMTFNGGMERSENQWRALLEKAGYKVQGFYTEGDGDGIVEAIIE